ncbi:SDR family NAD(P)-dependent oxidoreductase [Deinococcus lacus]|uniref:SDR family NAD(P)-dependent oxidoreductase n=1 Tax=Deinococcus lacus TaxID=392561 RepID=A0ABW1YCZ1_9DEIO
MSDQPTPRPWKDQVVAVTGADRGYGRAIARGLARAGARVILIGRQPEPLATAAGLIEEAGGLAIPLQADVAAPLDWLSAQGRILDIFGALDGIVHLADRRSHPSFNLLTEGEWMELFSANVKSSVAIAQLVQRRLPGAWMIVVGPHQDEKSMPGLTQRGALRGLVEHAAERSFRMHLALPSRASAGDMTLDQPLVGTVLSLGSPELAHLRGLVMEVPMPPLPKRESVTVDLALEGYPADLLI